MDFVYDQLAMGKKLRILTVVDTHWLSIEGNLLKMLRKAAPE